jgi:hypothetical protein
MSTWVVAINRQAVEPEVTRDEVATPHPAPFATGLNGLRLLGWRRKRK